MPDAIPGRFARLEISQDGGTTYHRFGGIKTVTKNTTVDDIDVTDHDSDGHGEALPGHDRTTFDVDANFKDGDPGQNLLIDAAYSKQVLMFKFYMQKGVSGRRMWSGRCFVTSESEEGPLDDAGMLKFSLRGSGVTPTRQP